MSSFSALDIKKLRSLSGSGFVDCKKALLETNGDIQKSVDLLRKKGLSASIKRSERTTSEGVVAIFTNRKKGVFASKKTMCSLDAGASRSWTSSTYVAHGNAPVEMETYLAQLR